MSGKQAYEQKIEQLQALRADPLSPATKSALAKALKDRSHYLVSKAATLAAELECRGLIPDLVAAFERFLHDPLKSDVQCWAKIAIIKTLKYLQFDDSAFYKRGIIYQQREPFWQPPFYVDTAVTLRGECAFALIECCPGLSDLEILDQLTDLLADPEAAARQDAARALAHLGRPEGALLLRLKIRNGDPAPAVVGQCFSALLSLSGARAVPLVDAYMGEEAQEDLRFEAAAALGESHLEEAFVILQNRFESTREPRLRQAILLSIGSLRQQAAIDFLLSLINASDMTSAVGALAALAPMGSRKEVRAEASAAVERAGSERLRDAFRQSFPE